MRYSHSFKTTGHMSAVSVLESREQRYITAISNNNFQREPVFFAARAALCLPESMAVCWLLSAERTGP